MTTAMQTRKLFNGDTTIWVVMAILSIISLWVVFSSAGNLAYQQKDGNTTYYLFRQFVIIVSGFGILYMFHLIPFKIIYEYTNAWFILSLVLLVLTVIFGFRQYKIMSGLTFQTSDMAKTALVLFLARNLSLLKGEQSNKKLIYTFIIASIAVVSGLIATENFSTSGLIFISSVVLMFAGNADKKIVMLLGLSVIAFIVGMYFLGAHYEKVKAENDKKGIKSEFVFERAITVKNRIDRWLGIRNEHLSQQELQEINAMELQSKQAKIAIVTGGPLGKGIGKSTQRNSLPQAFSDFIYAIIIEEYGLWGSGLVLLLYLIIFYRTAVILKNSETVYAGLLALGLTLNIIFQAFTNMGVSVCLLPVTGQPLPYVSIGGTSILFTSISIGIIISISKEYKKPTIETES